MDIRCLAHGITISIHHNEKVTGSSSVFRLHIAIRVSIQPFRQGCSTAYAISKPMSMSLVTSARSLLERERLVDEEDQCFPWPGSFVGQSSFININLAAIRQWK
ncbi:hypothetical protein V6N13_124785 [Hibiscus sabdariffa]